MPVDAQMGVITETESEDDANCEDYPYTPYDRLLPFTLLNSRLSVGLSVALLAETALRTFSRCKEEDARRLRSCALRYHDMAANSLRAPHLFSEQQQNDLQRKLDRLSAALRRFPITPEKDASEALQGLTPRETEALRYIAEGSSTKEVAARMGIRFKTAVCHRYKLMEKLNIHDTASLVRYAIRHGVIEV
ncbi:MAG: LuxR C-terminal-related transcriptional regulator [Bryobacteraceae bacterium]